MKSILFTLAVIFNLSTFAYHLNTSHETGEYKSMPDFCAKTYFEAFLVLEEMTSDFNNDESYRFQTFVLDYALLRGELGIRNGVCKLSMSGEELNSVKKCSSAVKEIYTRLDNKIDLKNPILSPSSEVQRVEVGSIIENGLEVLKAEAICLTEGVNLF